MFPGHGPANRVEHPAEVRLLVPLDLLNHDQLFPAVAVDRKGRAAIGPQSRMALLHRPLDVLRIVVHAVNDDQVLQPPGDEQFAVLQESQVAGAEEGPFLWCRRLACRAAGVTSGVRHNSAGRGTCASVASGCRQ